MRREPQQRVREKEHREPHVEAEALAQSHRLILPGCEYDGSIEPPDCGSGLGRDTDTHCCKIKSPVSAGMRH